LCKTQKIDVIMKVIAFNIDRLIRIRASIVLILLKIRRISY
jgi:hypothetical protein